MLSLPDLMTLKIEKLGGEVIPRSVLLAVFEGMPYLLCALGDGQLFNWLLDPTTGELRDKKKICLGTKPIMLRSFRCYLFCLILLMPHEILPIRTPVA